MVLFDQVQSLDVTGPLEVFTGANTWRGGRGAGPAYDIRTASLGGRPVRTSSGLRIAPDEDLREVRLRRPGLLIVPGGEGARRPDPELTGWLRAHGRQADRLVSVCTGAFLLAAAGLLDGRRVTTHWAYCASLAAKYPQVSVEQEPIFVRDGNVATSAGVTAGIDLALALVEDDLGRDVALDIARQLVVFLRRPGNQAQFSAQLAGQLANREPLREVQRWIADHPGADLSVEALARQASLSPRQFARAFAAEVGMPPGRYVDLLDGRRVTTHWAYCGSLAAKYPQVSVEEEPIFVRDGNVATSAGVTAGIDLALALVEDDLGRDVALDIARQLVVFLRRPGNQAQFSAQLAGQLANREPLREVQQWIADHPGADLSVEALARQASLSPRQFARAFAAEVGMPPGRYVDRVRLETARRRLEDTADGVEQTARSCGYGTPEAMRRAFVRVLGVSPGEYRRRFRPAVIGN